MLYARDVNGLDLTVNPPADLTLKATTAAGLQYLVQAQVVEDDASLPIQSVVAALDWGDGLAADQFPYTSAVNGTLAFNSLRLLPVGQHILRLEGQNFEAPAPRTIGVNFTITVLPRLQEAAQPKVIFGPILPKDTGFPNNQQWNFTTGSDLEILASSVKMLLVTGKGERVMEPDYGTNLRVLLFEGMAEGLEDLAQREIVDALTRWEPRVTLQTLSITRSETTRSVTVFCLFVSRLDQRTFDLPLAFSP